MIEQEAIERIKSGICNEKGTARYCNDNCMYGDDKCAYSMAIKALEEIQQYRALGTVNEIQGIYVEYIKHEPLYKQYRAIGTVEQCREAVEKKKADRDIESHDEKHILESCIALMQEMVNEFAEWYKWQHGEDAIEELDEEERFCIRKTYFRIVQELFLIGTNHSGGTSTRAKCEQLGVDWSKEVELDWSEKK